MSSNVTCPFCQAPLNVTEAPTGQPFVCPHCLTNITNPQMAPASEAPNVLRDIRRKVQSRWWIFWLLIGLGIGFCVFAIVWTKVGNTSQQGRQPGNFSSVFDVSPGFLGLDILVLLAIAVPTWRYVLAREPRFSIRQFFIIASLVLFTILLALAIGVFFIAVCFAVV